MAPTMTARPRDAACVVAVALVARLAVVAWARGRFPAVDDGYYYDILARRLASGAGYTWLWPDGAVTYAAHYPVGYPGTLALAYAVFGGFGGVAAVLNALIGAAGAWAAHALVEGEGVARWRSLSAGIAVALHPALLLYTPALMTEGVTASLLVAAAALAGRGRRAGQGPGALRFVVASGVVMGLATLVRPQSLVLAPLLGGLAARPDAMVPERLKRAGAVTAIALACVLPWTIRNCARMGRCALVSVNGGWNLLIGSRTASGAWEPLVTPPSCAAVWDEAAKDDCFARAARREIASDPGAWLARVPTKMSATFDYFGAAPMYLHKSNPAVFGDRAKVIAGSAETLVCRLLLLLALSGCALYGKARMRARQIVAVGGAAFALTLHGWIGYSAIVVCAALLGPRGVARAPLVLSSTVAVIAATAAVHAAFFGAGRYGLVVVPFVTATALALARLPNAHPRRAIGGANGTDPGDSEKPPRPVAPATSGRHIRPVDAARAIAGPARSRPSSGPLAWREESPSSTEHDAG